MTAPDWKRRHEALWDAADQHALALEYLNPGAPKSYLSGSRGRSFQARSSLERRDDGSRVYRYCVDEWRAYDRGGGDWVEREVLAELERPVESTTVKVLITHT